jgi:hypothetical protein
MYLRSMLPTWPPGTPAILVVSGLHAIPVSSYVRRGDDRVLLAVGSRRETLARLRADSAAAFCVIAKGAAFTAYCGAAIARESMTTAPGNTAVELHVEHVQDHLADGRTAILDGARWEWTDDEAAALQPHILRELEEL